MKNIPLFISRLIVIVLLAGLISSAIGLILMSALSQFGFHDIAIEISEPTAGIIFGVAVGYKLNDLIGEFKK